MSADARVSLDDELDHVIRAAEVDEGAVLVALRAFVLPRGLERRLSRIQLVVAADHGPNLLSGFPEARNVLSGDRNPEDNGRRGLIQGNSLEMPFLDLEVGHKNLGEPVICALVS